MEWKNPKFNKLYYFYHKGYDHWIIAKWDIPSSSYSFEKKDPRWIDVRYGANLNLPLLMQRGYQNFDRLPDPVHYQHIINKNDLYRKEISQKNDFINNLQNEIERLEASVKRLTRQYTKLKHQKENETIKDIVEDILSLGSKK